MSQPIDTNNKKQRRRNRDPEARDAFCSRLRMAVAARKVSQRDLAKKFGGFSLPTTSRIFQGEAHTVPIDFMVRLAEWAMAENISLVWLMTGSGPMELIVGEATR